MDLEEVALGRVYATGHQTCSSGNGSSATSYSGGTGSGAIHVSEAGTKNLNGYSGMPNGGKGGDGLEWEVSGYTGKIAGGAGNPGGFGYNSSGGKNLTRNSAQDGQNGTRRIINYICKHIF